MSMLIASKLVLMVGMVICALLLPSSVQAFMPPAAGTIRSAGTKHTRCHTTDSPRCLKTRMEGGMGSTETNDMRGAEPASRGDFVVQATNVLATTAAGLAVLARPSEAGVFADDVLGFKFETPDGWERGETQISGRREIIVYTSSKDPGANAFIVYTPVRGDFTSLGSFGTLDEVSKTVLPEGEGISSKLVDAYTVNKSYVYDYIVTQEGRPRKHIKTLWLLFPAEGQLATVTAQCDEDDYGRLGKTVDNIIASIKKT